MMQKSIDNYPYQVAKKWCAMVLLRDEDFLMTLIVVDWGDGRTLEIEVGQ